MLFIFFLKKKKEKCANTENEPPVNHKKSGVTKTLENEKKKQHDALMDEFKKVHRKMFAHQDAAAKHDINQSQAELEDNLLTSGDTVSTLLISTSSCLYIGLLYIFIPFFFL